MVNFQTPRSWLESYNLCTDQIALSFYRNLQRFLYLWQKEEVQSYYQMCLWYVYQMCVHCSLDWSIISCSYICLKWLQNIKFLETTYDLYWTGRGEDIAEFGFITNDSSLKFLVVMFDIIHILELFAYYISWAALNS